MHNFTTFDLIVVLVYLVGIGGWGIYQAVKIKSSGDYFAGGRKFSKWLMMMHALGTGTHADDPVIVTGAAYAHGLSGIWYTFVYLFVTPFYWIIAPFFRRSRFITTADFFKERFGSKMALLYSLMGVITFALYIGMMLKATGTLANAVTQGAMPEWLAIFAMTIVFVGYGLAGGLVATVMTESIQGVLIVVMSVMLVPFGLARVGGVHAVHHLLTPDKFSLHAPTEMTIPWIIAGSVMMLIGIVSQPHIMEVCSTGKTEFEGRVGFTYGNFVKRFCAIGWAFTGVIVLALVAMPHGIPALGTSREAAFGTAIRVLLPSGFTGLMFAAILAAQMSTLSAFMVASSALLARNVFKQHIKPSATDAELLSLARWVGLLVVGIGVLFALGVSGVAQALTINWAVSTLTGVLVWAGVLWKRTNSTGAWISFILMAVLWLVLGPAGGALKGIMHAGPQWLGVFADKKDLQKLGLSFLPAGIIAVVLGSLLSSKPDKQKLDRFFLLLKTPVGREGELTEAGVNVVYAGSTKGHPWELKYPRLVNLGGFLVALVFSLLIFALLYFISRIGA